MKIRAAVAPLMNRMKTRGASFAGAVAVALGMMSLTPAAPAQQPGSQATIPFAFSINQQEFPAGHYRVQLASENVLRLVSYKTGESAGVVVRTTRNLEKSPRNVLVFEHDDQGYELTSVQFGLGPVETQAALRSKAVTERMKFTRLISAR